MDTKEIRYMKRSHYISPFLAACVCLAVLAMSCLTTSAAAQTADNQAQGDALAVTHDVVTSNVGKSMIYVTKQVIGSALNDAAVQSFGAAWQANKMGGSSATIGGLLEQSANLKDASNILNTGNTVIGYAGFTSTAAGEIAGGSYMQGFITIANGLGKSVASGIASAAGASFGTLAGPAGTITGGAVGGFTGRQAWDETFGKLTSAIKTELGKQEDKRQFREMSGPLMRGMTSEEIHEASLKYKKELTNKKKETDALKTDGKVVIAGSSSSGMTISAIDQNGNIINIGANTDTKLLPPGTYTFLITTNDGRTVKVGNVVVTQGKTTTVTVPSTNIPAAEEKPAVGQYLWSCRNGIQGMCKCMPADKWVNIGGCAAPGDVSGLCQHNRKPCP
jgi:hypothetical protein